MNECSANTTLIINSYSLLEKRAEIASVGSYALIQKKQHLFPENVMCDKICNIVSAPAVTSMRCAC